MNFEDDLLGCYLCFYVKFVDKDNYESSDEEFVGFVIV